MRKKLLFTVAEVWPKLFYRFLHIQLLVVFMLLCMAQAIAKPTTNNKISVEFNQAVLSQALYDVEQKSGYHFTFADNSSMKNFKVSLKASDMDVLQVVERLLVNTGMSYELLDNNVIAINQVTNDRVFAQINGKVAGAENEPLVGVSVTITGRKSGTSTDANGFFTIEAGKGDVLLFTMVGYKDQSIKLQNETSISITLQKSVNEMNEVVVVGYGTQKKANLTGAVSTIDAKMLESRPVQNVGQALQGLMPGLNFQTAGLGGELNQNLSFNIRGGGTIGAGSNSSPLVLIDGMEGNLNAINPQDIETITVLKDAASSAIYGSRAPFGVVLITTKKGKAGKVAVNYNNNIRSTSPLGLPHMMDSRTFAMYYNEAAANDGEAPKFSGDVLDRIIKFQNGEIAEGTIPNSNGDRYQYYTGSNANTDWFKEMYKNSALSQDHSLSVSGGTNATTYYLAGNFLDQAGLSRHSHDGFNRYTLTAKINTELSKFVKFNYSTRFVREDYTKATHQNDLLYHNIARRWPTVPAKDPNGFWSDPSEISQLENGGRTNDQSDWLYTQGQLVITPLKNWNIFAEGNFRSYNYNNHSDVLPAYSYDVFQNPYPLAVGYNSSGFSSVYEYNRKENFFSTNIYSNYSFNINKDHQFKILGGFNSELNKYRTLAGSRTGLISPSLPTINTATNDSKANEGQYQHWATAGFFGRLNYNFKEKYLLEVNARYDGTSRFLADKRWNLFPSVSAGWNIAKEKFWTLDRTIQMFKLRASYGELGNQNTSNWYPFFAAVPIGNSNGQWLVNGSQPNTAGAPGLVSTLLTWERVASYNIGLDMAMFRNKLTLNVDYFNRKTFDMVGPAPELPVILGTSVPQINNADMESYGFEVEAKWRDRIGNVNYSVRGVLSDDQQRVTNYPNPTGNISNWYNGRKSGEIWGYTTVGMAKTQAEMDGYLTKISQNAMGSRWGAGDIMYADLNGDGKIDGGSGVLGNTGDRGIIGNTSPRYRFSLDLGADWNGFDFRMFLQGVAKRDYMPGGPYFWGANGGMWQSAGFTEHMDFFRDENSPMVKAGTAAINMDSYFPKPYFNTGKNQATQTRYLQNAAYVRLKNLQIGYSLPHNILTRLHVSKVRIYLSGENLLTATKMISIFDPETVALSGWSDGKTYPLAKVISAGLSVNF